MCQFPRLPTYTYVFSARKHPITGAGFTHSEIRGSKAIQRLTAAYRSRSRPSSASDAKASTVCPSYLDGDQNILKAALFATRKVRPFEYDHSGSEDPKRLDDFSASL